MSVPRHAVCGLVQWSLCTSDMTGPDRRVEKIFANKGGFLSAVYLIHVSGLFMSSYFFLVGGVKLEKKNYLL